MKSRPQFSIPLQNVAMTYERQDEHRRNIVNHAIAVQDSGNTVSAIEYLKAHEIAAHVIERVLLEPARRRGGCTC